MYHVSSVSASCCLFEFVVAVNNLTNENKQNSTFSSTISYQEVRYVLFVTSMWVAWNCRTADRRWQNGQRKNKQTVYGTGRYGNIIMQTSSKAHFQKTSIVVAFSPPFLFPFRRYDDDDWWRLMTQNRSSSMTRRVSSLEAEEGLKFRPPTLRPLLIFNSMDLQHRIHLQQRYRTYCTVLYCNVLMVVRQSISVRLVTSD